MNKLCLKAMSVNKAYLGKKVKSKFYRNYEELVMEMLPEELEIPDSPMLFCATFGLSSSLADWDNPVKPFVDILQSAYSFNDKEIFTGIIRKAKVKEGEEYIDFKLTYLSAEKLSKIIEIMEMD